MCNSLSGTLQKVYNINTASTTRGTEFLLKKVNHSKPKHYSTNHVVYRVKVNIKLWGKGIASAAHLMAPVQKEISQSENQLNNTGWIQNFGAIERVNGSRLC
jgi:hypothetical protein